MKRCGFRSVHKRKLVFGMRKRHISMTIENHVGGVALQAKFIVALEKLFLVGVNLMIHRHGREVS